MKFTKNLENVVNEMLVEMYKKRFGSKFINDIGNKVTAEYAAEYDAEVFLENLNAFFDDNSEEHDFYNHEYVRAGLQKFIDTDEQIRGYLTLKDYEELKKGGDIPKN